jgi:hypothetical protein
MFTNPEEGRHTTQLRTDCLQRRVIAEHLVGVTQVTFDRTSTPACEIGVSPEEANSNAIPGPKAPLVEKAADPDRFW